MSRRSAHWFGPALSLGLLAAACGEPPSSATGERGVVPRLADTAGVDPGLAQRIEEAAEAVEAEPTQREAWLELAGLYDANQIWASAEQAYLGAIALEADARSTYHLARVRVWIGDLDAALEAFDQSLGFVDWYAPTHARRAKALMELGRLEEARAAFQRSIELDAGTSEGRLGLARLSLIEGDADAAVATLEPLVERSPGEPFASDLLARAYRQLGDTEAAERAARRGSRPGEASLQDPWVEEVRKYTIGAHVDMARADAALAAGDVEGALAMLEPHRARFSALNRLLDAYLAAGRIADAEALTQEARAAHGDHFRVELAAGRVCVAKGALRKASGYFENAITSNPRFGPAFSELGGVQLRLGDPRAAIESFRRAMAEGERSARDWTLLARALLQAEEFGESLAVIEDGLAEYPNSANLWGTKASVETRAGMLEEARASLARLVKHHPKHEAVARVRARIAELEAAANDE